MAASSVLNSVIVRGEGQDQPLRKAGENDSAIQWMARSAPTSTGGNPKTGEGVSPSAVRAVFIDRDGVLIEEINHLTKIRDVKFIEGAFEAIRLLGKSFLVIVVSNQSVVARGMAAKAEVEKINSFIKKSLAREGAAIDAFYYCPHHPDFTGECDCRKPAPGLFFLAQKDFNIDLSQSFMIGDKTCDLLAGKNAGCRAILVKTGYAGKDKEYDSKPDITASNLLDAVKIVFRNSP